MRTISGGGWFEGFMGGWRHVIQVSERTLIDNVAATVPWLAPVAPAYMAWHNAVTLLGWPAWVAWVVAAAIEGLGLSVVSTAFQLWRERRNTFWVAVVTTVFYLAVVITVNVALDLGAPAWFAKALLSLLSVPAAVTIALRTSNAQVEVQEGEAEEREYQRQVDAEERARRHELRVLKAEMKVSEKLPKDVQVSESYSKSFSDWRQVPADERGKIAGMSTREIMAAYGKSERTATNWKKDALREMSEK